MMNNNIEEIIKGLDFAMKNGWRISVKKPFKKDGRPYELLDLEMYGKLFPDKSVHILAVGELVGEEGTFQIENRTRPTAGWYIRYLTDDGTEDFKAVEVEKVCGPNSYIEALICVVEKIAKIELEMLSNQLNYLMQKWKN